MKRLIKWLFILLLIAIAVIVGLVLSKDALLKAGLESQIRSQTGMDVKIGKFSLGLLSPVVSIENLKLYNTPEFGGTPFVEIRELHLEYDRDALAKRKLHITLLRLNVAEFTVVRNDAGKTNLANVGAAPAPKSKAPPEMEFTGVDVANLSIGKTQFIDLKNPANNRVRAVNLQNQIFRNLKTPGDLYGVLLLLWIRSNGSGVISAVEFPDGAGWPTAAIRSSL